MRHGDEQPVQVPPSPCPVEEGFQVGGPDVEGHTHRVDTEFTEHRAPQLGCAHLCDGVAHDAQQSGSAGRIGHRTMLSLRGSSRTAVAAAQWHRVVLGRRGSAVAST
ncbi:hypothetical protein MSMEG_6707 [Mycolicibacterium smegmatis MC2 155]|uniref:Uncharacterized protein n=1 Tax=Mycolicibacterium smegmatis (strain ATCC 700084 / mc(2)155) TaxID=246196 RepID=A0R6X6_MYCS2|nr:hypothetical protein MSMEG_6707 [Mycolicibacterium smegmatis MC2 155]